MKYIWAIVAVLLLIIIIVVVARTQTNTKQSGGNCKSDADCNNSETCDTTTGVCSNSTLSSLLTAAQEPVNLLDKYIQAVIANYQTVIADVDAIVALANSSKIGSPDISNFTTAVSYSVQVINNFYNTATFSGCESLCSSCQTLVCNYLNVMKILTVTNSTPVIIQSVAAQAALIRTQLSDVINSFGTVSNTLTEYLYWLQLNAISSAVPLDGAIATAVNNIKNDVSTINAYANVMGQYITSIEQTGANLSKYVFLN